MRNQPKMQYEDDGSLNEDQMNSLIQNYQSQIQAEVEKAHVTGYGLAGVQPQNGTILNMTV